MRSWLGALEGKLLEPVRPHACEAMVSLRLQAPHERHRQVVPYPCCPPRPGPSMPALLLPSCGDLLHQVALHIIVYTSVKKPAQATSQLVRIARESTR
jgi:hypothetical protein